MSNFGMSQMPPLSNIPENQSVTTSSEPKTGQTEDVYDQIQSMQGDGITALNSGRIDLSSVELDDGDLFFEPDSKPMEQENIEPIQNNEGVSSKGRILLKKGDSEAIKIAKNNLAYSKSLYLMGYQMTEKESEHHLEVSAFLTQHSRISNQNTKNKSVKKFLKDVEGLGFKESKTSPGVFYSRETGTVFTLTIDNENKQFIMSFSGMGAEFLAEKKDRSAMAKATNKAVVQESLGKVPKSAKEAEQLGKIFAEAFKDDRNDDDQYQKFKPVVTGHSHGGGLAQCAAIGGDIKGVVFNSRPVGGRVIKNFRKKGIEPNNVNITAFSNRGDFLSGKKSLTSFLKGASKLFRFHPPQELGQRYTVSSAGRGLMGTHNGFHESLKSLSSDG